MRITQAFISKSVQDFPWLTSYALDDYRDKDAPCIFFGCYRYEDLQIILQHRGPAVIFWCGQDALDFIDWDLIKHIHHITGHNKTFEMLKNQVNIKLIKPYPLSDSITTEGPMGNKIYAYVPKSAPEYHGSEIIAQLKTKFEIIIGDGSINQAEWRAGKCNEFYNPAFIGLMLSPFAGGGSSIIEMGLRGRRCVTNVFEMPHTIKWETIQDIEAAIEKESENIGTYNAELAIQVRESMGSDEFLFTEFYK